MLGVLSATSVICSPHIFNLKQQLLEIHKIKISFAQAELRSNHELEIWAYKP